MLLEQERGQGAMIRADGRACGIGMSVFVDERFADAWMRRPEPHLGKRLLLTESLPESPILTVQQFTQIVGAPADRPFVLGRLIQAFVETHVGFGSSGSSTKCPAPRTSPTPSVLMPSKPPRSGIQRRSGVALPAALMTVTREQAAEWRTPLLPMFLCNPPRIIFSDTERQLLRAALGGDPDQALAGRLGLSVSAVKARWSRIQQRAMRRLPDLFERVAASGDAAHRGPQVRHFILRYLRTNPSELRPSAAADPIRRSPPIKGSKRRPRARLRHSGRGPKTSERLDTRHSS